MLFKLQVDIVWSASGERCQPHVGVILSAIHSIDQVSHNTWVSAVFMENIDVARVRPDLTYDQHTCCNYKNLCRLPVRYVTFL